MAPLLHRHSPRWQTEFRAESQRITEALAGLAVTLHHIGSTAIEGILAKPIIDMLLVVDELEALPGGALQTLGYEALGEYGIPGRRYFRKSTAQGVRSHHLHAYAQGSPQVLRHLAFRDYMNAHPEAAGAYSALKHSLAEAFPGDSQAYVKGKDGFVKEHEAKALVWAACA